MLYVPSPAVDSWGGGCWAPWAEVRQARERPGGRQPSVCQYYPLPQQLVELRSF